MQKILLILHLLLLLSLPASLQVTNQGANIVMNQDVYLVLKGNLKNNGLFNQNAGTVKFIGAKTTISGTIVPEFFNLQLALMPGSSELDLETNITVKNAVQFVTGLINLNSRNITLLPTAVLLGESETSRITGPSGGFVQITVPLNFPKNANPGNLGAVLTRDVNYGNTTIRRGHQSQPVEYYGKSILRYYHIIPTTGSLGGAKLGIHFFNAEINGLYPGCLVFYGSVNSTAWNRVAPVILELAMKYAERTAIPNYPYWTLSTNQNPFTACTVSRLASASIAEKSPPPYDFIKRIYPTAGVKNSLYVETGNLNVQTMQVMLYDAQGNLLLNKQIAYQSQWLTIPAVSAGVYQVKVLSTEHIWQGKFVKD